MDDYNTDMDRWLFAAVSVMLLAGVGSMGAMFLLLNKRRHLLAVSVACENEGQMIWFSSSNFLDDMYNAYSSGANLDLAMNALSSLIGENEAVAIRSKSLSYSYLTISESTASLLKTVMIGIFPLAFLGIGIIVVVRRRRQNEPV